MAPFLYLCLNKEMCCPVCVCVCVCGVCGGICVCAHARVCVDCTLTRAVLDSSIIISVSENRCSDSAVQRSTVNTLFTQHNTLCNPLANNTTPGHHLLQTVNEA